MASRGLSAVGDRVSAAVESLGDADRLATAAAFTPREEHNTVIQLDAVIVRETDLRKVRPEHARNLAASIATVGLISPFTIDSRGKLLAGEHRRTALSYLREVAGAPDKVRALFTKELGTGALDESDVDRLATAWARAGYERGVPARRMSFNAEDDAHRAFTVEVAENTQRQDFTRQELLGVYDTLSKAGYRTKGGRPGHGEKAIMPALSLIFGRHVRNLRHMLNDEHEAPKKDVLPKTVVALRKLHKALNTYASDLPDNVKPSASALLEEITGTLEKRGQ